MVIPGFGDVLAELFAGDFYFLKKLRNENDWRFG